MSLKFYEFANESFLQSLSEIVKFRGFNESERLENRRFFKKVEDQVKIYSERFQEINSEEDFSEEEKNIKKQELWVCESELNLNLNYEIIKKAPISELDINILKPALTNLPEEYK